jgi:PII-like signaling protein
VVFSEDLPVIIEIVDSYDSVRKFAALLDGIKEIGLVTCEDVGVLICPSAPA